MISIIAAIVLVSLFVVYGYYLAEDIFTNGLEWLFKDEFR